MSILSGRYERCFARLSFSFIVGVYWWCFPFLPAFLILGEDVRLVPYQRDCRIGGHWTGMVYFPSFVSALGLYVITSVLYNG